MNAPQTPYERFMSHLPTYGLNRSGGPSWPLYERLKDDFQHACPGVTPTQYEQAMIAIAKVAGV